MGRTLVLLVVTLALGVGVGYLLGEARSQAAQHTQRAAPRGGIPSATPGRVQAHGNSDLARALRTLPVPQAGLGTGRIRGTVRDDKGRGVAGVTVRAVRIFEQASEHDDGGPPPTPDLEDAVRRFVHDFQRRALTTVDAVTGKDGTYLLEGLAKADYALRAYLVEHEVKPAAPENGHLARPGATFDWIARAVATLRVDVLLPDGTRPQTAWIHCKQGNDSTTRGWSPDRPEIRLPPGHYELSATADAGPDEYKADAVERVVSPGVNEGMVVFRLRGSPGIRGEVRFANGLEFRGLRVYALRFAGNEPPPADQLTSRGKETWVGSGRQASYTFHDLPPGRYLVGVGASHGTVFAMAACEVKGSMETCDLEIGEIAPEEYVTLRVLDPEGKPVPDVDLDTGYETATSSTSGGSAWVRKPDGTFLVFHHGHDTEEGGTYTIRVTSEKFGRKSLTYRKDETRELEVRFGLPATLKIRVEGFASHPHAASVSFGLLAKSGESAASDDTPDGTGALTLGPVESGEYQLVTYVFEQRYERIAAEKRTVSLRPGENRISVALPRLYPLTILAESGTQLQLSRLDDDGGDGRIAKACDSNGRASFPALPAGRYQILSWGPGGGQMEVTLPGPAEVTFKPEKMNALRVTVTDADGTIAKAGFQNGDLVVAIDGSEFESLPQLQMLLAGAMSKEEVTFTVLRGGRRVDVVAKMREMMRGEQGGRLDPARR